MTIQTKFNVRDEVWVMYRNKPINALIMSISVDPFEDNINYPISIRYELKSALGRLCEDNNKIIKFSEGKLFETKEELIKSL